MCIDNNVCKYSIRLRSSPAYNYWNRTVTDKHITKMNIYTFTWTWYFQWNQFHQLLGTIGKFPIFCSIFSILYYHVVMGRVPENPKTRPDPRVFYWPEPNPNPKKCKPDPKTLKNPNFWKNSVIKNPKNYFKTWPDPSPKKISKPEPDPNPTFVSPTHH